VYSANNQLSGGCIIQKGLANCAQYQFIIFDLGELVYFRKAAYALQSIKILGHIAPKKENISCRKAIYSFFMLKGCQS
jgi:hypothetical protein